LCLKVDFDALQLLAAFATAVKHVLLIGTLGLSAVKLLFQVAHYSGSLVVRGLSFIERLLAYLLVLRRKRPIPVSGADLLDADLVFV